jgi:hypothetical protein
MRNDIGDKGAEHLVQALQSNAVRDTLPSTVIYQLLSINTDTRLIESLLEQYR